MSFERVWNNICEYYKEYLPLIDTTESKISLRVLWASTYRLYQPYRSWIQILKYLPVLMDIQRQSSAHTSAVWWYTVLYVAKMRTTNLFHWDRSKLTNVLVRWHASYLGQCYLQYLLHPRVELPCIQSKSSREKKLLRLVKVFLVCFFLFFFFFFFSVRKVTKDVNF